MALNDSADPNLHTIKTKLYEHHFDQTKTEGKYIARTVNERTLTIQDIVDDMISLDKHGGSRYSITNTINSFIRTKRFRLADGYAVSDGLTISYPKVMGTFNAPNDPVDREKHRVVFKHINCKASRELAQVINIEITDIARASGRIYTLRDTEEDDMPNNKYIPGNMVLITGRKIKIAGDHPDIGVYFISADEPSARVKMTRIGENHPGKILGIAPNPETLYCRIEIVTQFTGNGVFLKEPRVITSDFVIEAL